MGDRAMHMTCLIGAIVGIIILYFVSSGLEIKESMINQLDEVPDGDEVLVRGVVKQVTNKDKVAFLEVAQEEVKIINVVLFKKENISLAVGDYVEIEGTTETYLGEKEIIGSRVEVK